MSKPPVVVRAASLIADNRRMVGKLVVVTALMFAFGYALVPIYRTICDALGVNVLAVSEVQSGADAPAEFAGRSLADGDGRSSTPTRAARGTSSRRRRASTFIPARSRP